MKGLFKFIKRYKNYVIILTSVLAGLVIFLQNIEYIFNKTRKFSHSVDKDLIIVDSFISGDTFDIRLINKGEDIIAFREVRINVDSTWEIYQMEAGTFDPRTGLYDVNLPDSLKSYSVTHKIFQSIKPHDVDRFQIILRGGDILNTDSMLVKYGKPFNSGIYFIQFNLEILLDDTDNKVATEPMIHVLGLHLDTTGGHWREIYRYKLLSKVYIDYYKDPDRDDTTGYHYYNNRFIINRMNAISIANKPFYKSEKAKVLVEDILTESINREYSNIKY